MSQLTFTEAEVLAFLETEEASPALLDRVKLRFETVRKTRHRLETKDEYTRVIVASHYGHLTKQPYVAVEINDERHQWSVAKALEVADMLRGAAEAAVSDALFMALMQKIGITEPQRLGLILMDLRELRQGSRDVVSSS